MSEHEFGGGYGVPTHLSDSPPPPSDSPPPSEPPPPPPLSVSEPAPPEFSQQTTMDGLAHEDTYANMEPPSPMDPHAQSLGMQSSVGSIREDIDVNSQGLVEETLERLGRVRGVLGVLILDSEGTVIRTTMDERSVSKYTSPVLQLLQRAHGVVGLTPNDRLGMLCVRTSKHEMLMCSERHAAFSILVIQNPSAELSVAGMVAGM
mmetsp:Transcript_22153/g.45236  ORF Transcript_22153/g.45236 Transcript_22153/m.45236 type:complete len:205 (-) Transcript_22153:130-744(-)|eukprot:CAMPEP_0119083628 /NCGR_PEP_ID=MMETSP1178-20130426/126353_1 /TAXON_ID=33656 /ORGANISM="unid sp, Strain CCMP2000" /LENGTH=204 /DNA_ID=CAMNT_0007066517 /DNA_START=15 /DNA_END=629 /DNA_ORIENTATION=+